jgi:DNA-binding NtrC family response regulator
VHDWPGNVRELENAIERAVTLCENDIIQTADLPPGVVKNLPPAKETGEIAQLPAPATSATNLFATNEPVTDGAKSEPGAVGMDDLPLKDFLREQELAYLNRTLAQTGGDKEKAALILGISLATLYRKLSEDERPV